VAHLAAGGAAERRSVGRQRGRPLSQFEYIAIAFSLIYSFSVMRLVGGISHALDPNRRHWVHLAHVGFQLAASAVSFWVMWSYHDAEWTLRTFLLVLAGPALFYFNATVLIPEAATAIESWRVHYFSVRRRYWVAICLWAIVVAATDFALLGAPLLDPARAMQSYFLALGVTGAVSEDPRVHSILVPLVWLPIFVGIVRNIQ
jgi:hypothetical protein